MKAESWSGPVKPERVVTVNWVEARVRSLAERWSDPEFWKDKGAMMDSRDCANELLAVLNLEDLAAKP